MFVPDLEECEAFVRGDVEALLRVGVGVMDERVECGCNSSCFDDRDHDRVRITRSGI